MGYNNTREMGLSRVKMFQYVLIMSNPPIKRIVQDRNKSLTTWKTQKQKSLKLGVK